MNKNKFFIYARKSSDSEDRQVLSIDSQINELQLLAKRLKLNTEVIQESKSAKAPGRTEFGMMMERIYAGEASGIICWKLDRLARNSVDGGAIIWAIKQQGIEIITPSQTYNQAGENSFMMYVEFGMAQKFVDDLSKNVKRGLKAKAEKGWRPSGAPPGFMSDRFADKGNKTIKSHPTDFPLIRKCWDLMLTGTYSPPQILDKLNNEWGYRTPVHRKLGGRPMSRSKIYQVFTDEFYMGKFTYQGVEYQGKHQAMVTPEEFWRVQSLLGIKGRPRPKSYSFKYTGLLRCGQCQAQITAEHKYQIICSVCKKKFASRSKTACPHCNTLISDMKNPTNLHYVYYHCTKRKDPNCTQGSVTEEKLEAQIDEQLSKIQISDKFKDWAIKYLNELHDTEVSDRTAVLETLQSSYNGVVKRIDNLVSLKISPQNSDGSLLSDEEFKNQKASLMKEKVSLEERLKDTGDRVKKWTELAEKTFNFAVHARYWFANGDEETKRQIFASLSSNMTLQDKIVLIDLQKPFEQIETIKQEEDTILEKFEPKEKIDLTGQIEALYAQNTSMLRD
jgi:site-specific DNA recombinase